LTSNHSPWHSSGTLEGSRRHLPHAFKPYRRYLGTDAFTMPTSPGHAPTRHTFTCIKTMHAARSQPGRLSLTDASSHLELRQHRCSKIFRPAQDTGTLSLCLCLPASLRRSMVFHVFVSLLRCRHISMIVDQTGRLDTATYLGTLLMRSP